MNGRRRKRLIEEEVRKEMGIRVLDGVCYNSFWLAFFLMPFILKLFYLVDFSYY